MSEHALFYVPNCSNVVKNKLFSVQIPCATLRDVINYLVEKTDGVLVPLIIEEAYEKNICTYKKCFHLTLLFTPSTKRLDSYKLVLFFPAFIRADYENGETTVQQPLPNPPSLPPKPGILSTDAKKKKKHKRNHTHVQPLSYSRCLTDLFALALLCIQALGNSSSTNEWVNLGLYPRHSGTKCSYFILCLIISTYDNTH